MSSPARPRRLNAAVALATAPPCCGWCWRVARGGLSLNQTASWAALQGLPALSGPGLKYRLDKAVPFLKAILEQQLAERAQSACLHWPGRFLTAVDGSYIRQPASEGYDWRLQMVYDLGRGDFSCL